MNEIWSLFDDGWATFEAKAIPLSEVLGDMIPSLRTADVLPGVFYVVGEGSVDLSFDELEADLREALVDGEN